MPARFHRRLSGELGYLRKRAPLPQRIPNDPKHEEEEDDPDNDSEDEDRQGHDRVNNPLAAGLSTSGGPITITVTTITRPTVTPSPVISVVRQTSTPVTSSSSTRNVISSTTTTSSVSTTAAAVSSVPSVSQTSVHSSSLTPLTPSPSVIVNGGSSQRDQSGSSKRSLSSGAIAGIVIVCVIILLAALIFGVRKRFMRERLRAKGLWIRSKGLDPIHDYTVTPWEPKTPYAGSGSENISPQPDVYPVDTRPAPPRPQNDAIVARVPVPPLLETPLRSPAVSFGNDMFRQSGEQRRATRALSPVVLNSAPPLPSPFISVIKCTFIPSLPDELSINVGETVRVLAEYDDNWALCVNSNGEQGMVPIACLDRGYSSSVRDQIDIGGSRRASSLPSNGKMY